MRAVSLVLAASASLIGLIFPFLLAARPTGVNQSILMVMMVGIVGAFIHGTGFTPLSRPLRLATSPWLTWPLIAVTTAGLVLVR